MTYPGNPSLALDVQRRIVETFLHTLATAESGNLEEARLGCDFVLRLDSLFAPAQALADRLAGASGPVEVTDLRQRVEESEGGAAGEPPAPPPPAPLPVGVETSAQPMVGPSPGLAADFQELLAQRRLQELMTRAQAESAAVTADPELRSLVGEAQELLEAAPYVDGFLDQARAALSAGSLGEVEGFLDKARALDAGHPAIDQIQQAVAAATPERGSVDVPDLSGELGEGLDLGLPDLDLGTPPELPEAESDLAVSTPEVTGAAELRGAPADPEPPQAAPSESPGQAGPSDSDPRIAELLDEGQAAFERGEFQSAVDAWSRIFLIDIDHAEAARRIDLARDRRAEKERQAEEGYHDALGKAEAGDLQAAKASLQQVLDLQGSHAGAREALEKLERGEALAGAPDVVLAGVTEIGEEDLKEEILVPPDPDEIASSPPPPRLTAPGAGRTFKLVGAVVLALAAAVGGYLFLNRETWFPNSEPVATVPLSSLPEPDQTPISRAQQQYQEGQRALAIARLKRIPPASPYHQEAQALVSEWEGEEAAAQEHSGLPSEVLAQRATLLEQAQNAASARRFLEVRALAAEAADIAPLERAEAELLQEANQRLEPLDRLLALVRDGEHELALRDLWRLREQDPTNPDVRSVMVTAYFNRGVLFLQQGRADQAREALEEASKLAPDDAEIARLATFARAYSEQQQDLLYRILVKYLAARTV